MWCESLPEVAWHRENLRIVYNALPLYFDGFLKVLRMLKKMFLQVSKVLLNVLIKYPKC